MNVSKPLFFLIIYSVFSCNRSNQTLDNNRENELSEIEENLKVLTENTWEKQHFFVWSYIHTDSGYIKPEFKEKKESGLFYTPPFADQELMKFTSDSIYKMQFPRQVEYARAYHLTADSLQFDIPDPLFGASLGYFFRNDTLYIDYDMITCRYREAYLPTKMNESSISKLVDNRVDWSMMTMKWLNNYEATPIRLDERNNYCNSLSIPRYLDLTKKNSTNYSFNRDTLIYFDAKSDFQHVFKYIRSWLDTTVWACQMLELEAIIGGENVKVSYIIPS